MITMKKLLTGLTFCVLVICTLAFDDPYCKTSAEFAVNEMRNRGDLIDSYTINACGVTDQEYYYLYLGLSMPSGNKICEGVFVRVRQDREGKNTNYQLYSFGTCHAV